MSARSLQKQISYSLSFLTSSNSVFCFNSRTVLLTLPKNVIFPGVEEQINF